MKSLRLIALVFIAAAWTSTIAFAGGECAGASAAAKGGCTAHASTHASAAANCPATAGCPMGSAQCNAKSTSAAATAKTKGAAGCTAAMAAQCTPEMKAQCNAKSTSATAAAMPAGCCGKAGASAASAKSAKASGCAMHASATTAGNCDTHAAGVHGDCSVCSDESECDNELRAAGAHAQVVALRNGAMIVYTTETASSVHALQTTMARYHDHIMSALASGSAANLCPECKSLRGALASGKFNREIVNVKSGCQILLTSSDRNVVRRIHDMTGAQLAARGKS